MVVAGGDSGEFAAAAAGRYSLAAFGVVEVEIGFPRRNRPGLRGIFGR